MDCGPLSEDDTETLETWLAGDSRRLGALMRARALFSRTESAWSLEPVFNPDAFVPQPVPSRRNMLRWGAGGAVAATFGAAVLGYGLTASKAYATGRGEMRQVPLADGSKMTLNTLSKVEVGSYFGARNIRLVSGEILLSLAREKQDSILRVGDWRLQAGEAAFFVSDLPERPPLVTVHHGLIEVTAPGGTGGIRLGQGCRLALTATAGLNRRIEKLSDDQLTRELSWLDGQLDFHDESVGEAVQAFARYNRQPIVIRDPALARETVSGLFAANDPVGFARAIGTAFGVAVRVDSDRILLG